MKKLLSIFCNSTDDGLIFAQINGSVLAVFIGLFSAYYMYLFSNIDSMEFDIFKEAAKVNAVQGFNAGENEKEFREISAWDSSGDNLIYTLKELFFLSSGAKAENYTNDKIERGKIALFNISKLSSHFPFPPLQIEKDGIIVGSSSPEPLTFNNIPDVEKWLRKIDTAAQTIFYTYTNPNSMLPSYLSEYINTTKNPEILDDVFHRYLNGVSDTLNVIKSLDTTFVHYNIYCERHLSKGLFVAYLIFAFATFSLSVFVPMLKKTVPTVFVVGLPISYYLTSFLLIIFEISKL